MRDSRIPNCLRKGFHARSLEESDCSYSDINNFFLRFPMARSFIPVTDQVNPLSISKVNVLAASDVSVTYSESLSGLQYLVVLSELFLGLKDEIANMTMLAFATLLSDADVSDFTFDGPLVLGTHVARCGAHGRTRRGRQARIAGCS